MPEQEREALVETARKIVQEHVAPHAARHDLEGSFPSEGMRALAEAGLLGLMVPRRYGGMQADHVTFFQVTEEIARGCASTAMLWTMHHTYVTPVVDFGNERLKELLLPDVARGRALVTGASTEPQGGGGALLFYAVERVGDELVLNAKKSCVSGANHADWIVVLARSDPKVAGDTKTLILAPGIKKSQEVKPFGEWNTVGMRATVSSGLLFENCRVPSWHEIGDGRYSAYASGLPTNLVGYSTVWASLARVALEVTVAHTTRRDHERFVADRRKDADAPERSSPTLIRNSVATYETVQRQLGEMTMKVDAAFAVVEKLAARIDRLRPDGEGPIPAEAVGELRSACNVSRLVSGEAAVDVCRVAMRLCGLRGLQRGFPIERLMRDALTSATMAPGEDTTKTELGKRVAGLG